MEPAAEVIGFCQTEDWEVLRDYMVSIGLTWQSENWRGVESNQEIHRYDPSISAWHRDGNELLKENTIVVWSNREQTEVLDPRTSTICHFNPYEVVLIHNQIAQHRMPAYISPDRLFVRLWKPQFDRSLAPEAFP